MADAYARQNLEAAAMTQLLVAYSSKHGATAEIAEAIADELRRRGNEADCLPAEKVDGVDAYDAATSRSRSRSSAS